MRWCVGRGRGTGAVQYGMRDIKRNPLPFSQYWYILLANSPSNHSHPQHRFRPTTFCTTTNKHKHSIALFFIVLISLFFFFFFSALHTVSGVVVCTRRLHKQKIFASCFQRRHDEIRLIHLPSDVRILLSIGLRSFAFLLLFFFFFYSVGSGEILVIYLLH
jgi:uncharacterized membrane protein YhaH (DUF805 family)